MLSLSFHSGSREVLMPLFAEADDSETQIASYRDLGEILIAQEAGQIVGLVQIVPTDEPGCAEIKSIAVVEGKRSQGIGTALLRGALDYCRSQDVRLVSLATAAASVQALQFYQRHGFRLRRIIRDFYSPERGYRPLLVNGIPLLDEVILDFELYPKL